jgi:preprotein translocase subunit SecE
MSANQKTLDENPKRRPRRFNKPDDEQSIQSIEADDDLEEDDSSEAARGLSERKGRATPGRRSQEVEVTKESGNFFTRRVRGLREYIEGVRSEVQKVVWPTRAETRRLTRIVLVTTIISSIILGIISLIFNELFALGLRQPLVFFAVFALILGGFLYYLRRSRRSTPGY